MACGDWQLQQATKPYLMMKRDRLVLVHSLSCCTRLVYVAGGTPTAWTDVREEMRLRQR